MDKVVFPNIKADVEQICNGVCHKRFKNIEYNHIQITTLVSQSNEEIVNALVKNNRNFKYIVKTMVVQKKNNNKDNV